MALRGGPFALNAPPACFPLRVRTRARGQLQPGTHVHLGALLAPVGTCRHGTGHHVSRPADVADVQEVGGGGPPVESAEPDIIPALAEGVPELQQAGPDTAPVTSAQHVLPEWLPRVCRAQLMVV